MPHMPRFGLLIAGSAVAALLAGCSSGTPEAAVQDTSPGKILSGEAFLTGLGLEAPGAERPRPDTRPRADLVIPPSRALPDPERPGSFAGPAWPNDPDRARDARRAALRAANNDPSDRNRNEPMSPEESLGDLDRMPISQRRADPLGERLKDTDKGDGPALRPNELRRQAAVARAIQGQNSQNASPTRRLTDPPEGYLERPEGAPPPEEKKKRRWWPFGSK